LDPGVALAARTRGEGLALRARDWLVSLFRQHRRLRRDVGRDPSPLGCAPDALGGKAGVGADRLQLRAGEADAVEQRLNRVALEAASLLALAGNDHAVFAIDRHLAAVD